MIIYFYSIHMCLWSIIIFPLFVIGAIHNYKSGLEFVKQHLLALKLANLTVQLTTQKNFSIKKYVTVKIMQEQKNIFFLRINP